MAFTAILATNLLMVISALRAERHPESQVAAEAAAQI
jgi:hypothetical protein